MCAKYRNGVESRDKLMRAASALMENRKIEEISVQAICEKAGVTTGTFYHNFKDKHDLINQLYGSRPQNYAPFVESILDGRDCIDKLIGYAYYFAKMNENTGLNRLRFWYDINTDWLKHSRERSIYLLLRKIVGEGQEQGILRSDISEEDLSYYLFNVLRSCVTDWVLYDGNFDLSERTTFYMKLSLPGVCMAWNPKLAENSRIEPF